MTSSLVLATEDTFYKITLTGPEENQKKSFSYYGSLISCTQYVCSKLLHTGVLKVGPPKEISLNYGVLDVSAEENYPIKS